VITIKSERELEMIRQACGIVSEVLSEVAKHVKSGVTTLDLEELAKELIEENGAVSAFIGYRGYPAHICTSVNSAVVHGIPNKRPLREGDILSLDVGIKKDGYYGDGALTLGVGRITEDAQRLLDVTESSLRAGINKAQAGGRVSDISNAVQAFVEARGFGVVRDFSGHGIGARLHEDPPIPNFGPPHHGPKLKPGMVLAIEPMVNEGTPEVEIQSDGWTAITKDRRLSAHFEQVVAITEEAPEVLTTLPEISVCQKKKL